MNSFKKNITQILAAAFLGTTLFASPQASAITINVNFDSLSPGAGMVTGTDLNNYLSAFGLTMTNISSGSTAGVASDQGIGSSTVYASSPHNYIEQTGPQIVSYTLAFDHILDSFSFTRTPYFGATSSGLIYPQWSAQAFDISHNLLGTVGEPLTSTFRGPSDPVPAQTFTFSMGGIQSVTFTGNHQGIAGRNQAAVDDLVLNYTQAAPEPSTILLILIGGAGLCLNRRKPV